MFDSYSPSTVLLQNVYMHFFCHSSMQTMVHRTWGFFSTIFNLFVSHIHVFSLHPDKRVMEELHRRGYELELEILNAREDWADILTTTSDPAVLQSLGLANCTLVAHLPQLIASELQENWRVLKHHISIKGHNEFVSLNNEQVIDPQRTFLKHLVRRALNPQSSKADCHGREHADCVKNKKKEEDANEDWFQSYVSGSRPM